MSFKAFLTDNEWCDKCGVRDQEPMLYMRSRDRLHDDLITIHRSCLNKILAKIDKEAAK